MIVAITGGGGFIGGELVLRHLKIGDEVRVLSRNTKDNSFLSEQPVKWFQIDVDDNAILEAFVDGADILYHCAGETYNKQLMQSVNVEFTQKLIVVATGVISKWVQLSTVGVYGHYHDGLISEESPCNPVTAYEKTKLEADKLVIQAAKQGAFKYVLFRPTIVYGERMRSTALYRLFSHINRGTFFFIGSKVIANYVHVSNVVDAMIFSAKSDKASDQTYIVSDSCAMEHFVSTICIELNVKKPSIRIPEFLIRNVLRLINILPMVNVNLSIVDAMTTSVFYDGDKILKQMDSPNFLSIEEGVTEMVKYWKKIEEKPHGGI